MSKSPNSKKEGTPQPPAKSGGNVQTMLMVGVVAILATIGFIVWLIATDAGSRSGGNQVAANDAAPAPPGPTPGGGRLLPSGLRLETVREGRGPLATPTDIVHFRYELRPYGGQVLESNMTAPQPARMPVAGLVPGFQEGLTYMRAGGEARFWIPPRLGYGDSPPDGLSPHDTLEFRVRLERIEAPRAATAGNTSAPANPASGTPTPGQ